jgi:imidazolonepropionase-like amidohydrolase
MRIARRTCRLIAAAAGVLLPLATVTPALAEGPSFAVRAGRVMPVSPDLPAVIENGIIVVRDGRIEAVGADIAIPSDLELIEMPDATITPGFVAASSSVAGRHQGDESFGAGYRAADTFNPWDDDPERLGSGVTTVHLNPGWHRLVTGQGAIARMGGDASGRVMNGAADLTITLGPAVLDPAPKVTLTIPPSPDNAILPAMPQRPGSRMTQFLGLKEAIEHAQAGGDEAYSVHTAALREAWESGRPLRVQAQAAADLAAALGFFAQTGRAGYLVGGMEATEVAGRIAESGLPLVYTMDVALRSPGGDIGGNPTIVDRSIEDLAHFGDVRHLAIALADGAPLADLRLAAAMALRSGLSHDRILAAITRVPAEILGIGDEVGSLAPGRRADMLVLNGDPLATATTVQRVYVDGRVAHRAMRRGTSASPGHGHGHGGGALVVRADTVWLGPGDWLSDGEVLIEDGVITEVGRRVSRPAMARVVDAGPGSFVTPGLIDAHGHLGLDGDRSPAAPNLSLARLIGVPDRPELRTAAAGVTSVMLAPYGFNNAGSRVAAIKTDGPSRSARVVSDIAAVAFSVGDGEDIRTVPNRLRARLKQGQQYVEKWTKYETELAEWKEKAAKGEIDESAGPEVEQTTEEGATEDPITGTWSATLSGGPLPEAQSGTVALRLEGNAIEGRITEPELPTEVRITGTLDGNTIRGEIEVDTGGMGTPTWEGVIIEPGLIRGTAGLAGMVEVDFVMRRTSAAAVEFKVTRTRRTTGAGGRPLPPEIDESLEPIRALLEKRAPALVEVRTRLGIDAVLDVFRDEFDLPLVLLEADEARLHAERLKDGSVGVVLPADVLREEDDGSWYHQGRDLSRHGVTVAFQSGAEDGARTLRDVGLFSVSRGLSAERALAAMTVDVARMYGLHDRIGSIAPGRDGDLVIFSGYPFDAGTRVERVFINGEEVRP